MHGRTGNEVFKALCDRVSHYDFLFGLLLNLTLLTNPTDGPLSLGIPTYMGVVAKSLQEKPR